VLGDLVAEDRGNRVRRASAACVHRARRQIWVLAGPEPVGGAATKQRTDC
jgi:hypothetical protein